MTHQNERLMDGKFSSGLDTLVKLARHRDFTVGLAEKIRKENGVDRAVRALVKEFGQAEINPFSLTVEEILTRLRKANEEQGWGITEETFKHLAETVPPQPKGRLSFRSLRIRFGKGAKGVKQTFEAHARLIKKTFEPKFWRWEYLRSDKKHLRLLSGNETHTPTIEWCVIDLDAHRKRDSIQAVRGPDSLADEGLVFTWLYPEYVRAIDYKENPAFFLAGYELNVPEDDGEPWQYVPCVRRLLDTGRVDLDANWRSYYFSDCSVPSFRE